jgi:hypothetical protein
MERRRSPRFARNDQVLLKQLSDVEGTFDVRIVDASDNGMRIESTLPLRPGTLIQIEGRDTLLLGEVLYCQTINESHFLGVELTSALFGLADLRRLNRSLIQELEPRRPQNAERTPVA